MKTTLYFIRHGEKDLTKKDKPLSDIGRRQAEKTGRYLSSFPIEKILASPSLRTRQTAEIINTFLRVPIVEEKSLRERIEMVNTAELLDAFLELWHKASQQRYWKPPIGNSSYQTGKRMERTVEKIKKVRHVVLVSHGGAISDFLRNIFSAELTATEKWFYDIAIHECSVTILHYDHDTDAFTLQCVNEELHLM